MNQIQYSIKRRTLLKEIEHYREEAATYRDRAKNEAAHARRLDARANELCKELAEIDAAKSRENAE